MSRKALAGLLFAVAAAIVGYWLASGANLWTQDRVLAQVSEVDPVTNETVERTVWRDEYQLGGLDRALPSAAALIAVGGALLWLDRRRARGPRPTGGTPVGAR